MPPVHCFLLEPSGEIREEAATCCSGKDKHRIVVESYVHKSEDVRMIQDREGVDWPETCPKCGAGVRPGWIIWGSRWKRVDNGEVRDRPEQFGPGAMFDADWMPWKGPDGRSYAVVLPEGGLWAIDGHATNCQRPPGHCCWTRSGTAPHLTVTPSIRTDRYHGHLRNGILVDA